mgnify:CR=1 FL=1
MDLPINNFFHKLFIGKIVDIKELKNKLKQAIKNHYVIEIEFKGQPGIRALHPYHFGINKDIEQLHAYQVSGPSSSGNSTGWKNLPLSDISKINVVSKKFSPPDQGYNPKSKFKSIEFQIQYDGMSPPSGPRKR